MAVVLPGCIPIPAIDGCLKTFLDGVAAAERAALVASLTSVLNQLQAQEASLQRQIASLESAIAALPARIAALQAEILTYTNSLAAMADFLISDPTCLAVLGLQALLTPIQLDLQDDLDQLLASLPTLQIRLADSLASLATIECHTTNLQQILDYLG